MPAKAKVTKEMIIDPAFAVARQAGAENINARTVSERLHCSTQPVMYHFSTIEELKRTVYAKADRYHSEYLMQLKSPQKGIMLGIGMNYIRFAIEEPHLFRFLFQSDYFSGKTLLELIDAEELTPGSFGDAEGLRNRFGADEEGFPDDFPVCSRVRQHHRQQFAAIRRGDDQFPAGTGVSRGHIGRARGEDVR